jgi:hypothetical protein
MTHVTSGTRFPTQRYAFEPISILFDVSAVRLMCVLGLQSRVCILHGPVITLMGHENVAYSTCMMRYLSQKHKHVIGLVVGPRADVRMCFSSQTIITSTHNLKSLRIEWAKQVGGIFCVPPPPGWANPIMFRFRSTRYCGVPLDYKREASWLKEGGNTTHTYQDHA